MNSIAMTALKTDRSWVALALVVVVGASTSPNPCLAQTCDIEVPADYPSIQSAINIAVDGSLICVSPGSYYENIDLLGKSIHLWGIDGPEYTVIDGGLAGTVVTCDSGETIDTVLEGFSLIGGYDYLAGGIWVEDSGLTVQDVIIENCTGDWHAGGIGSVEAELNLTRTILRNNYGTASAEASALSAIGSSVTMNYVEISNNHARHDTVSMAGCDSSMQGSWIHDNTNELGAALFMLGGLTEVITLIIENNTATQYIGVVVDSGEFAGSNVAIYGNHASGADTSYAFYTSNALATLMYSVIDQNAGIGVWNGVNSSLFIQNSVVSYNNALGGAVPSGIAGFGSLALSDSNVRGNAGGNYWLYPDQTGVNGNIDAPPGFMKADSLGVDQYRLQPTSPMIDVGNYYSLMDPDGSLSDIGVFAGPFAGSWDLDWDGYGAWWQPGEYEYVYGLSGLDCDDHDPSASPLLGRCGPDNDGDGFTDAAYGGWDCDDSDASVHPVAAEMCDGVDNNCDGWVDGEDAADALVWYQDDDGDGFGIPGAVALACEQPAGFAADHADCLDSDARTHPGAAEYESAQACMTDEDQDGFGDVSPQPGVAAGFDCDDGSEAIHPGATDDNANGLDEDCDGLIDNCSAETSVTQGPGLGLSIPDGAYDGTLGSMACASLDVTDVNDGRDMAALASVEVAMQHTWIGDLTIKLQSPSGTQITLLSRPGVDELHDDGSDLAYGTEAVLSVDYPIGYSMDASSVSEEMGAGDPQNRTICEDDGECDFLPDPGAGPGLSLYDIAWESPYGAWMVCVGDSTGGDLGSIDQVVLKLDRSAAFSGATWYADSDSDGYGTSDFSLVACDQPEGYVNDTTDCDDTSADIYPGAAEYCNSADDDCNGIVDDAHAVDALEWYIDEDGDGYGGSGAMVIDCSQPDGYAGEWADCDDFEASVNPGADEVCDDWLDNDCDGLLDGLDTDCGPTADDDVPPVEDTPEDNSEPDCSCDHAGSPRADTLFWLTCLGFLLSSRRWTRTL